MYLSRQAQENPGRLQAGLRLVAASSERQVARGFLRLAVHSLRRLQMAERRQLRCLVLWRELRGFLKLQMLRSFQRWRKRVRGSSTVRTDRSKGMRCERFTVNRRHTAAQYRLKRRLIYVILRMIYMGSLIFEQSAFWRWKAWGIHEAHRRQRLEDAVKTLAAVVYYSCDVHQ